MTDLYIQNHIRGENSSVLSPNKYGINISYTMVCSPQG